LGEVKTPQEMHCGIAKKRSLSNHRFNGRKSEDFRSHSLDKTDPETAFVAYGHCFDLLPLGKSLYNWLESPKVGSLHSIETRESASVVWGF
jgi:hypothetical protein